LILFDVKKTLKNLSDDCTPLVEEAIYMITPTKSLSQICVEHGLAYSELLKVAKHLVYWNQAKIIYPITLQQVYVIN
jgi:Nitrogen Permease regulator of amino acid transport activity 3